MCVSGWNISCLGIQPCSLQVVCESSVERSENGEGRGGEPAEKKGHVSCVEGTLDVVA